MDTDPYAVTASEQAAMSRRLETLVGTSAGNDVLDLTDAATASPDDAVEARLAAIEDTLDGLAERFEALTRSAASDAGDRFAGLEGRIERLHAAVVEGFGAELARLRTDLADALDEVREQVETTVGVANSSIRATLDAHGAAASGVLEGVQAEVKAGLAEMSRSLTGQFTAIRGVTGTLGGSTDRLVGAGHALLAYLGERDRWLERERDRVLHDVLDEFAQGLSGRGRRTLTSRMRDVVDRRRDARDAERFRQTEAGTTVIEIPAIPPELAELGEPVVTIRPAEPDRAPAAGGDGDLSDSPAAVQKISTSTSARARPAKKPATNSSTRRPRPVQTGVKKASTAKSAAKRTGGSSTRNH